MFSLQRDRAILPFTVRLSVAPWVWMIWSVGVPAMRWRKKACGELFTGRNCGPQFHTDPHSFQFRIHFPSQTISYNTDLHLGNSILNSKFSILCHMKKKRHCNALQELWMLYICHNCQVKMFYVDYGSELSEISHKITSQVIYLSFKLSSETLFRHLDS